MLEHRVQHQPKRHFPTAMNRLQRLATTALLSVAAIGLQASATSTQDTESAFLWQIETPTNSVYLMGSIHYLRPTDYPLAPAVQAAFQNAENLVFEVHPAELTNPSTAMAFLQGAAPDSQAEALQIALEPGTDSYEMVKGAALEFGLPIEPFHQFEPWFLAVTLSTTQLTQLGFSPESGVELRMYQDAMAVGKTVSGLETVEEQLGFFDSLSVPTQVDFLTQTVQDLDSLGPNLDSLVASWKTGDVEQFESLVSADIAGSSEMNDILLAQRNHNWIPQIEALLGRSEDYLVVVGAAHLVTDDGLVNLLENRGHTLNQL
ncbi:MAG: TraB/GumN family protein [Synechococcus sp.]